MKKTPPTILLHVLECSKQAAYAKVDAPPVPINKEQAEELAAWFSDMNSKLSGAPGDGPLATAEYYLNGGPLFGVPLEGPK